MQESGGRLLTGIVDGVNRAMGRLELPTEAANVAVVVAVGVGLTAVAGVAVAAGIGALYLSQQGKRSTFEKAAPSGLSPSEWRNAFDEEDMRLKGGGEKVIGKVRRGGVHPTIRAEVWPFLLGLFDGNSTESERKYQKTERSDEYEELRQQVRLKTVKVKAMLEMQKKRAAEERDMEDDEDDEIGKEGIEEERKAEASGAKADVATNREADVAADVATNGEAKDEGRPASEVAAAIRSGAAKAENSEEESEITEASESAPLLGEERDAAAAGALSTGLGPVRDAGKGAAGGSGSGEERAVGDAPRRKGAAPVDPEEAALEEFETWQRIIRLDAVRMNAQWIPYEEAYPHGQAEVSTEEAEALSDFIGLRDDSHLEPCRRVHAARLVAILEAYAIHDPEIGYCQGMSDLLSPFVALIEDDSEAFWCFERFMRKARHNFRVDEVGIRKQLDHMAKIIRISDPPLFQYLVKIRADDLIFAYRMVVVVMRRELSFVQTLTLWEIVWADAAAAAAATAAEAAAAEAGGAVVRKKKDTRATSDLLLYVIAAAIRKKRKVIMEKCKGMDEVLKEMNNMGGNIDLWPLLADAREMVKLTQGSV